MIRRTWVASAVVAAQVLVLVHMAGEREWVLRTGETVLLRTAPVDPRDPMRGDYARLAYDISDVPRALCRDGLVAWFDEKKPAANPRDMRVYALLARNSSGVAELTALTDVQPDSGLFIRGRVDYFFSEFVRVRYGIEALFMEQGKGRELETSRLEAMEGVPLDGEVALRADGLGVLKGCLWEPLGLRVTLEQREVSPDEGDTTAGPRRRAGIIAATLELKNHGDRPLAIAARAGGRSFRLVDAVDPWRTPTHQWVGDALPTPSPLAEEIVVLQPGDTHLVRLDLTRPEWFVSPIPSDATSDASDNPPVSLESLLNVWARRFRFEYIAPTDAECVDLPNADLIRRMNVRTRAFSPSGSVD